MSGSAFPLDAEQIVRLTGAVLARFLNAVRHPDAKRVDETELTLAIAESAGVEVPTYGKGWDRRLAPYSASPEGSDLSPSRPRLRTPRPTDEDSPSAPTDQQARGASDA